MCYVQVNGPSYLIGQTAFVPFTSVSADGNTATVAAGAHKYALVGHTRGSKSNLPPLYMPGQQQPLAWRALIGDTAELKVSDPVVQLRLVESGRQAVAPAATTAIQSTVQSNIPSDKPSKPAVQPVQPSVVPPWTDSSKHQDSTAVNDQKMQAPAANNVQHPSGVNGRTPLTDQDARASRGQGLIQNYEQVPPSAVLLHGQAKSERQHPTVQKALQAVKQLQEVTQVGLA